MRVVCLCVLLVSLLVWVEAGPVSKALWKPASSFLQSIAPCGSTDVFLTGREVIGVYDHSNGYSNNLNCTWTIQAEGPIVLTSRAFLLEESYQCRFDYVEIFDGEANEENSIGKFCGRSDVRLISRSTRLTINFNTDNNVTAPGFLFELFPLVAASDDGDATYRKISVDSEGFIQSPGYSSGTSYPKNMTWMYSLKAAEGDRIQLGFQDFSFEDGSCTDDYLTVYDGYSTASPKLGSYCGYNSPASITSSGNELLVIFHSDSDITSRGFQLHYSSVSSRGDAVVEEGWSHLYDPDCTSTIWEADQVVKSPHLKDEKYYQPKRTCRTVFKPPSDHGVKVQFRKLDIEDSLDCIYDHVNITFIGEMGSRQHVRLCGYHANLPCFYSTSIEFALDFGSDDMFEGTGYEVEYRYFPYNETAAVAEECDMHYCFKECKGVCYNNGNGLQCACPGGKVPPECSTNITWVEPLKGNLTTYKYSALQLSCAVNHPNTHTVWHKNVKSRERASLLPDVDTDHMTVEGSGLTIASARVSDSGIYTCTVQAGETILRQNIDVTVVDECSDGVFGKTCITPCNCKDPDEVCDKVTGRCKTGCADGYTLEDCQTAVEYCGLASEKLINPNSNAMDGKNDTESIDFIPWQVHLWNKNLESNLCAGVLISETHVLAAAHCIQGRKAESTKLKTTDILVSVGSSSCTQPAALKRKVSRYIIHPQHNMDSLEYDLAILELETPVNEKTERVYPICLPKANTWNDILPGYKGLVAGCGKNPKVFEHIPDKLHITAVSIVNRTKCERGSEDTFCGGGVCMGDSGGAFAAKVEGRWTMFGLVSFGFCNAFDGNDYYVNISKAMDWIQSVAPRCGQRRFTVEDQEDVKDQLVLPKQFPWVGEYSEGGKYMCLVTLISNTWAISARHCFRTIRQRTSNYKVMFGALKRNSGGQTFDIKRVVTHPDADMALIELDKKVMFSDDIQPACLPTEPVEDGAEGVSASWGAYLSDDPSVISDNLHFAMLTKANDSYCQENAPAFHDGLPADMCLLTAADSSVKPWFGDAGSGVIMKAKGRYTVTGVYRGGNRDSPMSVYTDILRNVPWIKDTMGWIRNEE